MSVINSSGNNDSAFACVASATVLHTEELTFVYYLDYRTNLDLVYSRFSAVKNYFRYRGQTVRLILRAFVNDSSGRGKRFEAILGSLKKSGVLDFFLVTYSGSTQKITAEAGDYLKSHTDLFDGTNALFTSKLDNAGFICMKIFKRRMVSTEQAGGLRWMRNYRKKRSS